MNVSDKTQIIFLQVKGDNMRKRDKEAAIKFYDEAATLAEKIGKDDLAKSIREKKNFL